MLVASPKSAAPQATAIRYWLRAVGVLALWGVAAVPAALGWQPCPFATLFHAPCPGCGMTRAVKLLIGGHWRASLRMHPLALPVLLAGACLALAMAWATLDTGAPSIHRSRFGRVALVSAGIVYAACLVLWGLRWLGCFGGPVPVS